MWQLPSGMFLLQGGRSSLLAALGLVLDGVGNRTPESPWRGAGSRVAPDNQPAFQATWNTRAAFCAAFAAIAQAALFLLTFTPQGALR
jgi:hypothetical protein